MQMMPNGNYEQVADPIQHKCTFENRYTYECIEYGWDIGNLHLKIEGNCHCDSDKIKISFCPFCGYSP
jgi:hypothetical protein